MFETGIALKQQYGEDKVFDLSLGNPVVEPPPEFRRELQRLAQEPMAGMHRYMPNAGLCGDACRRCGGVEGGNRARRSRRLTSL